MKKIILKTICTIFWIIGLIVTLIMISEPYYFNEIKTSLSSMSWRIKNNATSETKLMKEMEKGRENVDVSSGVQNYHIPNLKSKSKWAGMSVQHYKINIQNMEKEQQLIISHQIQTGTITLRGYLPSFSSYFSPSALPNIAHIDFSPEHPITCFSLTKYLQEKHSECYPISLFRWPETAYLDYIILGIYSENESEVAIYLE